MAGRLGWYAPWEKILDDSHKPFYRWFTGAKCNIVHNAIERHLKTRRRNKQALICEGEDGYFWVIGRIDDVIKVSGYRLGTDEIESALVSHRAIAEAAAIGLPHELKGSAIHCFVILRQGFEGAVVLEDELKAHVAAELGPIARPEKINFVASLPKTRSGKIMRRVLKAQALGQDVGDISTLEA